MSVLTGIIRSYHMFVTYPSDDESSYIVGESSYRFQNTDVQEYQAARVLLNILFFVSIAVAALYYRALKTTYGNLRRYALPEQRWQIFYMISVILFQNPFYCVVMWLDDPPVTVTYITYVIGEFIYQHSLLVINRRVKCM